MMKSVTSRTLHNDSMIAAKRRLSSTTTISYSKITQGNYSTSVSKISTDVSNLSTDEIETSTGSGDTSVWSDTTRSDRSGIAMSEDSSGFAASDQSLLGQTSIISNASSVSSNGTENIIMIFDWDDTLLPTTYLAKNGLRVDGPAAPRNIQNLLDDYSQNVVATLQEAMRYGTVVIVTNAETGWIDLTVAKFMPLAEPTVRRIRQMSARSTFEPQGLSSPFDWKERAFGHVITEHYSHIYASALPVAAQRRHVISFGDSSHEREAVLKVCEGMGDGTTCKSLKFMERPDLDHMKKEQRLIRDCLHQIVSHFGSLDLCIQCQSSNGTAPVTTTPGTTTPGTTTPGTTTPGTTTPGTAASGTMAPVASSTSDNTATNDTNNIPSAMIKTTSNVNHNELNKVSSDRVQEEMAAPINRRPPTTRSALSANALGQKSNIEIL